MVGEINLYLFVQVVLCDKMGIEEVDVASGRIG